MSLDDLAVNMRIPEPALCWKAHHGRLSTGELKDLAEIAGTDIREVWRMMLDEMARENTPENP